MQEKWISNIRIYHQIERHVRQEYKKFKEKYNDFDGSFYSLEPNSLCVIPQYIFQRYIPIFQKEIDFLWCLGKQYTTYFSFPQLKQFIERYADDYHLSKGRKKLFVITLSTSLAILSMGDALIKDETKKRGISLSYNNFFDQNFEMKIPNFTSDFSIADDDSPKDESEINLSHLKFDYLKDIRKEINIGKYIEFENKYHYQNIYGDKSSNVISGKGYLIAYFPYKYSGDQIEFLASLRSVDELNAFIEQNKNDFDKIYWKAAFMPIESINEVTSYLIQKQSIPYNYTSYFIDYEPKIYSLK